MKEELKKHQDNLNKANEKSIKLDMVIKITIPKTKEKMILSDNA